MGEVIDCIFVDGYSVRESGETFTHTEETLAIFEEALSRFRSLDDSEEIDSLFMLDSGEWCLESFNGEGYRSFYYKSDLLDKLNGSIEVG